MSLLTDYRLTVLEKNLGIYGIHVYQNGKTIAEHRFRSNDRENLYSASKTFVSIGIGIAEAEGLFKLSDVLIDYFPEYIGIASPGTEKIRIEHLLRMSSGHLHEDWSSFKERDRAEIFFSAECKEEPGKSFFYEDLSTYMLGRLVEKITGLNMLKYLKLRLFDKLGILNPWWHTCPLEHTSCSGGLYLTTEEFSRIGILLLNKGVFNEERVVPEAYIERMTSNWIDTSYKLSSESQQGYGYQVWKNTIPNSYRADGMYGQTCIVLQDYNAVITYTGHYEEYGDDQIKAIWKDILPQL